MMKKNLVMALAMTMGISALTYLPTGAESDAVAVEEKKSVTELFMVQSVTGDGEYMNAKAIDMENTQAEYGYILDLIYEVGDVVEVTYLNDDILEERLITGDELDDIYVPVTFYK